MNLLTISNYDLPDDSVQNDEIFESGSIGTNNTFKFSNLRVSKHSTTSKHW